MRKPQSKLPLAHEMRKYIQLAPWPYPCACFCVHPAAALPAHRTLYVLHVHGLPVQHWKLLVDDTGSAKPRPPLVGTAPICILYLLPLPSAGMRPVL